MTVYRVWPDTNGPASFISDNSAYTMGMQFVVTAAGMVTTGLRLIAIRS
jgi:hypothetical protein